MNVLGWFLAFAGFVGLIVGLLQMRKGKKMNRVPFRAPSEIAELGPGAGDAQGLVSTEGAVAEQGLLIAPMSGKPCIAYEIRVERKWEKSERTENGTQTKKGSDTVHREYKGGIFAIHDGAGQLWVDASTHEPDASFDKAHQSAQNSGLLGFPSTLQFGGWSMGCPSLALASGNTTAFEGTEKIIPPSSTLYALGAVTAGPHGTLLGTPKGIGTGKLILSNKGRGALVKATKRNMILGYALGGVMFVSGIGLGLFGPKTDPSTGTLACASEITDATSCDGRIYESDGKDHTWVVTSAGEYTITVSQPKVKYPIDAALTLKDAKGQIAFVDSVGKGAEAKVKKTLEPGTYTINVRDTFRDKVSGGYGFHLDIAKSEAAPPAAVATVTNADIPPVAAAAPAAAAPAKAPVGKAAVAAVKGGAAKPTGSGAAAASPGATGTGAAKKPKAPAAGAPAGGEKAAGAPAGGEKKQK